MLDQSGWWSVVFAKSFISPHAIADVAVHMILVATIDQLVRRRDAWGTRTHLQRRWWASAHKSHGQREDRDASAHALDGRRRDVVVDRLLVRGGAQVADDNPPWFVRCTAMIRQDGDMLK